MSDITDGYAGKCASAGICCGWLDIDLIDVISSGM